MVKIRGKILRDIVIVSVYLRGVIRALIIGGRDRGSFRFGY